MLNPPPGDPIKVLVTSRSQAALRTLQATLAPERSVTCTFHLIVNGHTDPMYGVDYVPDVVLLRFDAEHLAELTTLAESTTTPRPALVVLGPAGSTEGARLAVRSGARDFLFEPVRTEELVASLVRVGCEQRQAANRTQGSIDSIIGAAGGVGTSFIACNLAHLLATEAHRSCLLLDLDTAYSPLTHFLDLKPQRGLLEALDEIDSLDEHALKGYVSRHRSGLALLCAVPTAEVLSREFQAERLTGLLRLLSKQYQHVVVDVPHRIDAAGAATLGMSRNILIVLEQSVLHVKNAVKLLRILTKELGIPRERIRAVVNRFNRRGSVTTDDIGKSLNLDKTITVPNHYQLSIDSIDTAVPLFELDKDGPVVRSLLDLEADLAGATRTVRGGILGRIPLFTRK
jgi:pilus assembly protein CpaE